MRHLSKSLIAVSVLTTLVAACSDSSSVDTATDAVMDGVTDTGADDNDIASGCDSYDGAFASVSDLVTHECDDTYLSISSETGLPPTQDVSDEERIMLGITSWIQRVAVPYTYNWNVPLYPAWSDVSTEASPRGPIAVAIDGVPIFHYERRPDVSTALSNYTAENDTVLAGELDQCGGHTGQGDDYHYHYTPVCLLDDHDLSQPIAFGLDGAPVYFGEGGTDYYGAGQFNDWNNFPDGMSETDLDECNAAMLEDGSYLHYSTKTPPYLIGCHHAPFDTALQIEPQSMTGREQGVASPFGGEFGEPVTTLITDFIHDDENQYTVKFEAVDGSGAISEVIYRQVSTTDTEVCWEFKFRPLEGQAGEVQTACRADTGATNATGASSFEHNHVH